MERPESGQCQHLMEHELGLVQLILGIVAGIGRVPVQINVARGKQLYYTIP